MKGDITQRAARIAAEALLPQAVAAKLAHWTADPKVWQVRGRCVVGCRDPQGRRNAFGWGLSWREAVAHATRRIQALKPQT